MKKECTHENIYNFLLSQDRPVKSVIIEEEFDINGTEVRSLINAMRVSGLPIGSDNQGYRICRTLEDLDSTINNLNSRISGISNAVAGLLHARNTLYRKTA